MALINYAIREISAKIVYYGPGLSGKTTNIKYIHSRVQPDNRGKLVSLATETDRTLFFDFFPIEFGMVGNFRVRFHFYTVPGQVFYNTTRKLVLKGVDGVVFVADSQKEMTDSNMESLINLKENLVENGLNLDELPFVIQYNKRDLKDILPLDEMQNDLNPKRVPFVEASALTGDGVMETMKIISKMVLNKISDTSAKTKAPEEEPQLEESKPEVKEKKAAPKKEKVFDVPAPPPPPPGASEETPSKQKVPGAGRRKEIIAEPIILRLDEAGKNIQTEIVLPNDIENLESLPLSLPLILNLPDHTKDLKLKVNLSVLFLDKNGKEIKSVKKKKKGFFRRLFG